MIDVIVEDPRWSALEEWAARAVPAALSGLDGPFEVAILGCDDARVAALNAEFRGKPSATNVLSWPSETRDPAVPPAPGELGDIAIAYDTCAREAAEQGKPFDAHVIHLLVHATLHLLGHDHMDDAEAARMERAEVAIVTALGFPDPYASDTFEDAGPGSGPDRRTSGSDGQRRIV